jgi:hypothetical protein
VLGHEIHRFPAGMVMSWPDLMAGWWGPAFPLWVLGLPAFGFRDACEHGNRSVLAMFIVQARRSPLWGLSLYGHTPLV